jgi:hypothetical protein
MMAPPVQGIVGHTRRCGSRWGEEEKFDQQLPPTHEDRYLAREVMQAVADALSRTEA